MRIFKRQDFLKLPFGVVYAPMENWSLSAGALHVKCETLIDEGKSWDFYALCLAEWQADSSEEAMRLEEEMENTGLSVPLNRGECREGLYDDTFRYLVYERADLEMLKMHIDRALMRMPEDEDE